MDTNVSISTEELKTVAKSLVQAGEDLNKILSDDIGYVIRKSGKCLEVSGLNQYDIEIQFNTIAYNINETLSKLGNTLTNEIIPSYDELSETIRTLFNKDFAGKMNEIMAKIK